MNLYDFVSVQESLLIIGVLLLVVEIVFFGFATFFLFFIGLSCLITGLLMTASIIPENTISALSFVSIFSIIISIALWKHLKKLQTTEGKNEVEVGLVGHKFTLDSDLTPDKPQNYKYSGVNWLVKSKEEISAAQTVKVINVDVGVLVVAPDNS
tara:strand:+ start:75 stop:536 length:462 start_codon:yes stop_codon:yes gene_type:complete